MNAESIVEQAFKDIDAFSEAPSEEFFTILPRIMAEAFAKFQKLGLRTLDVALYKQQFRLSASELPQV